MVELDGFAVLGALARAPEVFAGVRAEASGAAAALVAKQLKAKALGLDHLRRVRAALGGDALALIVEGMKDAEVKGLAARLDAHHADLKAMPPAGQRRHLLDLAAGRAPAEKAGKPAKSKPAKVAPIKAERAKAEGAKAEGTKAGAAPRGARARASPGEAPPDAARTLTSKAMVARSPRRKAGSEG